VLARLGISALLLYWILRSVNISEMLQCFEGANWWYFGLTVLLGLAGAALNSYKWQLLMRAEGIPFGFTQVYRLYLKGFFFNNLTMAGIGDGVRVYDLSRLSGKTGLAFFSVFWERVSGVAALGILAILTLTSGVKHYPDLAWALKGCWLGLGIMLLILFLVGALQRYSFHHFLPFPRLKAFLEKVNRYFQNMWQQKGQLALAVGISLIPTFLIIYVHYFLALALHLNIPVDRFYYFIPFSTFFATFPLSFNGIGVQEYAFKLLFSLDHIPAEQSVSLSLLSHLVRMTIGSLGGLIYLAGGITLGPSGRLTWDPGRVKSDSTSSNKDLTN
jgi:glycosyltransferase 2 family protein